MGAVQHNKSYIGTASMVLAMLLVPGLDVISKVLMENLPPMQVTFGRFVSQTIILLPLFLLAKHKCRPSKGHLAAGAFLGLAMLSFNYGLQVMPVANALAIFFVEPLILTVLCAVVLQEKIALRRFLAILVGLCGVLIILRPNISLYGTSAFYPLVAAFLFSCFMLVTRTMSQSGGPLVLQFWTGFFAALVLLTGLGAKTLLVPEYRGLVPLSWTEFGLFIGLGLLAAVAYQLIVQALSRIEAGVAAPYRYLEMASAILLGWMVFGDFPDPLTWLGTAVIIASGIYVFSDALSGKAFFDSIPRTVQIGTRAVRRKFQRRNRGAQ